MKKYFGIELLRFLTSISVVLYHYRHFFGPYNSSSDLNYKDISASLPFFDFLKIIYEHGIFGVHVFYTISGFVFAHIYINTNKKINAKNFFVNRFARLYPLHFATLILITALQYFSFIKYNSFQIIEINDLYHFLLNIFFVSSWGFESGHSFNAPIWSVSVEVGIYIFFSLLLSLINRFRFYFVIFISMLLLIVDKMGILDTLFLECARLFFSGTLIYFLCKNEKYNLIFLPLSLLLIILSFVGNFKTFLFCPSLLLFFVSIEPYIKRIDIQNFFKLLGNLTYSLYLLHLPVQIIFLLVFTYLNIPDNIFIKDYFLILFFVTIIISSYHCFRIYEKPLNKNIRKILKNKI